MKIQTTRWLKLLFPTTVEIVGDHVIVTYNQLFSSQKIEIEIRDIYNVEVDRVFSFAELIIYSKMFVDNTIKISKLWYNDAEAVHQEIEEVRKKLAGGGLLYSVGDVRA